MRQHHKWFVAIMLVAGAMPVAGAEDGRVVSAGLFKNGLAVVTREYTLPGPGAHRFEGIGAMVHGAMWIEGAPGITARAAMEQMETESAPGYGALVGKRVQIGLRLEDAGVFEGILKEIPRSPAPNFDPYSRGMYLNAAISARAPSSLFVVVADDGTASYIQPDLVAFVRALEAPGVALEERPALYLEGSADAAYPLAVRVTSVARGLSWAPSYRLDISEPGQLSIAQSAVIRNELEALEGAALSLISGYPSIEHAHVLSPFSPQTSWGAFFDALGRDPREQAQLAAQMAFANVAGGGLGGGALPAAPAGDDGADLYYHPIGERDLGLNASLAFDVASAAAGYELVVEWTIPETRGTGHPYGGPPAAERQEADIWDAVRFKNPFPFPMTTAPAAVVRNGKFLGARTSAWANPGESTLVYVNKALSVRVKASEQEAPGRAELRPGPMGAMKSEISGALTLQNLRDTAISVIIHKELTGEFGASSLEPAITVGAQGAGRFNPSSKLTWELELAPGETREITYNYTYLVR
ncbi:MAG: hypothetical protein KF886_16110 [Candidatus Hydrogenedentes bacterium]|nr:hypothetical protein [Candidatus Hydrogenedentota bacterium]